MLATTELPDCCMLESSSEAELSMLETGEEAVGSGSEPEPETEAEKMNVRCGPLKRIILTSGTDRRLKLKSSCLLFRSAISKALLGCRLECLACANTVDVSTK